MRAELAIRDVATTPAAWPKPVPLRKAQLTAKRIGEPILTADRITLAFGGVTALNAISFEIRRREILAMIGPNGAGKTSMLNVINGFYHPQARHHHLEGRDPPPHASLSTPPRKASPAPSRTSRCSAG